MKYLKIVNLVSILMTFTLIQLALASLAYSRGMEDGARRLHTKLILKWLDENGELTNAPLLVYPPWIPNGDLSNINSKSYLDDLDKRFIDE